MTSIWHLVAGSRWHLPKHTRFPWAWYRTGVVSLPPLKGWIPLPMALSATPRHFGYSWAHIAGKSTWCLSPWREPLMQEHQLTWFSSFCGIVSFTAGRLHLQVGFFRPFDLGNLINFVAFRGRRIGKPQNTKCFHTSHPTHRWVCHWGSYSVGLLEMTHCQCIELGFSALVIKIHIDWNLSHWLLEP